MRLLASLTTAAAVLATLALPADAITRRVHVPLLDCYVEVETNDVLVAVGARGVRLERMGDNGVRTNC